MLENIKTPVILTDMFLYDDYFTLMKLYFKS